MAGSYILSFMSVSAVAISVGFCQFLQDREKKEEAMERVLPLLIHSSTCTQGTFRTRKCVRGHNYVTEILHSNVHGQF